MRFDNYNLTMRDKHLYWVFLSFFMFLATSCSLESEHNLGNGYYLLGSEANTVISEEVQGKDGVYNDVILGKIVDYDFDKKFIIVFRNASEKAKSYFEDHPLWAQQKGKNPIQYWIIVKSKRTIYGPFDNPEFLIKRKELGIPDDLTVNNAEK
jgi:hypothetical protein